MVLCHLELELGGCNNEAAVAALQSDRYTDRYTEAPLYMIVLYYGLPYNISNILRKACVPQLEETMLTL